MSVSIFGVRHHGPGCARSLRAALKKLQPDIVLVEGPPDAQEALPLLASGQMKPPVALLIYVPDRPQHAVYYPFTHFSPEWQALRYALERGIPARFMDLPQAVQLAKMPDPGGSADEHSDVPVQCAGARFTGPKEARDTYRSILPIRFASNTGNVGAPARDTGPGRKETPSSEAPG